MAEIVLDTKQITDWASFHSICKEAFGFPEFYGNNMNAWIDCMSYLTIDDGFTNLTFSKDELLHLVITDTEDFKKRLSDVFEALIECSAFVNNRYIDSNENFRISLIFI